MVHSVTTSAPRETGGSPARSDHASPRHDAEGEGQRQQHDIRCRTPGNRRHAEQIEIGGLLSSPACDVVALEPGGHRHDRSAGVLERSRGDPLGHVDGRVIPVDVADGRKVQPRDTRTLEHREVGVVRHAPVDLEIERRAARVRRRRRPHAGEPSVARSGLEQAHRRVSAHGLDVDHDFQPSADIRIFDDRRGPQQAGLLGVGEHRHDRPLPLAHGRQHSGRFHHHRAANPIVGGARCPRRPSRSARPGRSPRAWRRLSPR